MTPLIVVCFHLSCIPIAHDDVASMEECGVALRQMRPTIQQTLESIWGLGDLSDKKVSVLSVCAPADEPPPQTNTEQISWRPDIGAVGRAIIASSKPRIFQNASSL